MLRRDFLKLAAVAVGGLATGSSQQVDKLIPFLNPPENILPGVSTWFATSCRECPAGCGMIVRNREGRATKAEGNPLHPINAGRLCARGQAALQALYDPDRLRGPRRRGANASPRSVSWDNAFAALGQVLAPLRGKGAVALISDLQSGSLAALLQDWLKAFGSGSERYLVYEPFNYESLREANRVVFGQDTIPDYRLDKCDLIVALGADFTETWLSPVKFIRRFAETRVPESGRMSKFVYVGPRLSSTGFSADEVLLVAPGDEHWLALSLLLALGKTTGNEFAPEVVGPRIGVPAERIRGLARQLAQAKSPVVLAGSPLPGGRAALETAVAANMLNQAVSSPAVDFGRTHALGTTARNAEIADFIEAMLTDNVQALVILGANPAYALPPGFRFAEAIEHVPNVISLSSFPDETAELADWVLPAATPYESWGDYEPERGIVNLMQPTMGALFNTLSAGDILLQLATAAGIDPQQAFGAGRFYDYLQMRWAERGLAWEPAAKQGGSWPAAEAAAPAISKAVSGATAFTFSRPEPAPELTLWAYPSPMLFDGRGANKRWLQELPDPAVHAVWGSWAEMHPETAARHGIVADQMVSIAAGAGKIEAPAFLYRGVKPGVVAVPIGQGHRAYGRYAAGRGVNVLQLPGDETGAIAVTPAIARGRERVVTTDGSTDQHQRDLVRNVLLSQLSEQRPEEMIWPLPAGYRQDRDLYPAHNYPEYRWAMAVDMSRCVSCEACMAACYAENNVAVVGKEWMAQGREMEWIWVDRYYDWESPHAPALFQVMLCQQCDAAPCEPVCPVFASAHDKEGLNVQIYNRCIGTRYCSHNCPYKVRRFNWRNYDWPEPLTWQLNPEVTVRERGVMEKCTFCVQRIREAEHHAKKEGRRVRDGEITPACAQTCPAEVFVFGDLMDPNSRISRLVKDHPRRHQLLKELNTKPAVFYLKRVINDREAG